MSGTGHITDEDTVPRPRVKVAPVIDEDDIPTEEIPGLPILPEAAAEGPYLSSTPVLAEPVPDATRPQPAVEEPIAMRRRREMHAYRVSVWRVWAIRLVRLLCAGQVPVALLTPVAVLIHQWFLPGSGLMGWAVLANAGLWLAVVCALLLGEVSTGRAQWVSLAGCLLRSTTIALAGLAFTHVESNSWLLRSIGTELSLPWGGVAEVEPRFGRSVVMMIGLALLFPFILTIAQGARQHLDGTTRYGVPYHPGFKLTQVGHDPWTLGIPTTPLVISQYRRRIARFYLDRMFMTLWWLFSLAVMVAVATA